MGSPAQKKYLRAHKITNILFLTLLVPFLIISLLAAIIMFNTKSAGGYANFLGYYVYEIQDDSFKESTQSAPFEKGEKFLFHTVAVDDLKAGDYVIYYSKAGSETPTASTEPNWVPLTSSINPDGVQVVGEEETDLADMKFVQLADKKATITTEDGNRHVVFAYYTSNVKTDDHTSAGSDLLVYDNIVGVLAEDQNTFLLGLLEFCGSTSGFLILVFVPCGLLLLLKLISLVYHRRWEHEEELIRDTEIMASNKVSYNQALRGARKSRVAEGERISSSTRGTSAGAPNQSTNASKRGSTVPKSATTQREAPKPRAQATQTTPQAQPQQKPVQRTAPKPRTPKIDQ